jgi:hypothetical protein
MGKLAVIKTRESDASVEDFLNSIDNEEKRKDSSLLIKLMQKATKEKPKMWGNSLIGFGSKRYKSPATGREVDWFVIGFSPRKANISLHLAVDIKQHATALKTLGKHKTGAGCLYVNKLSDVDLKVLEDMICAAVRAK